MAQPRTHTEESLREYFDARPYARAEMLAVIPNPELYEDVPTHLLPQYLPVETLIHPEPAEDKLEVLLDAFLRHLPTEKRLEGLNAAEIAKNLSPEQLQELLKIAATLPKNDSPSSN